MTSTLKMKNVAFFAAKVGHARRFGGARDPLYTKNVKANFEGHKVT